MNRYVETMARARFESDWTGEQWDRANETRRVAYLWPARESLTALIAELRADAGAVEAIVDRMPFVPRDEAGRVLAAICDYLEAS